MADPGRHAFDPSQRQPGPGRTGDRPAHPGRHAERAGSLGKAADHRAAGNGRRHGPRSDRRRSHLPAENPYAPEGHARAYASARGRSPEPVSNCDVGPLSVPLSNTSWPAPSDPNSNPDSHPDTGSDRSAHIPALHLPTAADFPAVHLPTAADVPAAPDARANTAAYARANAAAYACAHATSGADAGPDPVSATERA